jgi:hypothetical protein
MSSYKAKGRLPADAASLAAAVEPLLDRGREVRRAAEPPVVARLREARNLYQQKFMGVANRALKARLERGEGTPAELAEFDTLRRAYNDYGRYLYSQRVPQNLQLEGASEGEGVNGATDAAARADLDAETGSVNEGGDAGQMGADARNGEAISGGTKTRRPASTGAGASHPTTDDEASADAERPSRGGARTRTSGRGDQQRDLTLHEIDELRAHYNTYEREYGGARNAAKRARLRAGNGTPAELAAFRAAHAGRNAYQRWYNRTRRREGNALLRDAARYRELYVDGGGVRGAEGGGEGEGARGAREGDAEWAAAIRADEARERRERLERGDGTPEELQDYERLRDAWLRSQAVTRSLQRKYARRYEAAAPHPPGSDARGNSGVGPVVQGSAEHGTGVSPQTTPPLDVKQGQTGQQPLNQPSLLPPAATGHEPSDENVRGGEGRGGGGGASSAGGASSLLDGDIDEAAARKLDALRKQANAYYRNYLRGAKRELKARLDAGHGTPAELAEYAALRRAYNTYGSYRQARLRKQPLRHFFDDLTNSDWISGGSGGGDEDASPGGGAAGGGGSEGAAGDKGERGSGGPRSRSTGSADSRGRKRQGRINESQALAQLRDAHHTYKREFSGSANRARREALERGDPKRDPAVRQYHELRAKYLVYERERKQRSRLEREQRREDAERESGRSPFMQQIGEGPGGQAPAPGTEQAEIDQQRTSSGGGDMPTLPSDALGSMGREEENSSPGESTSAFVHGIASQAQSPSMRVVRQPKADFIRQQPQRWSDRARNTLSTLSSSAQRSLDDALGAAVRLPGTLRQTHINPVFAAQSLLWDPSPGAVKPGRALLSRIAKATNARPVKLPFH